MGLGARLALVFAGVAMATALIVGAASFVTTDRQVTSEVDKFLRDRASEIDSDKRERPADRRDSPSNDQPVSADAEVQILNSDGNIVSNTGLLLPVNDADRKLANSNGRDLLRTVSIDNGEFRMLTDHLEGGGAIQVARSIEGSNGVPAGLLPRIISVAGIVALLAGATGWIVAQRTTRPLRLLTAAVDGVAQTGDFSVPVPATGRDEVGRLAHGFNRMLGALETSQEQQRRLVQDAAHELRTPLTSMTANVEWLMRAPDVDADTRRDTLAGVHRELGELNDLMAEIIELAIDSHQPPPLVATDIVPVLDTVVERFVRRTSRVVTTDVQPLTVVGDADSLARALTNLLNNAHKYSPPDASIGIQVGPDGVFVDDAGPGIPADEQNLVFDRFYRRAQDRSMPGSGLGLSIVAGIIEQHGGEVKVSTSRLGGARVGFSLPKMPG